MQKKKIFPDKFCPVLVLTLNEILKTFFHIFLNSFLFDREYYSLFRLVLLRLYGESWRKLSIFLIATQSCFLNLGLFWCNKWATTSDVTTSNKNIGKVTEPHTFLVGFLLDDEVGKGGFFLLLFCSFIRWIWECVWVRGLGRHWPAFGVEFVSLALSNDRHLFRSP